MTTAEQLSKATGRPAGMQARDAWTRRLQRWSRPFPGARNVGLRMVTPVFLTGLAARRRTLHASVVARGMGIWASCAMDWQALAQQLAVRCAGHAPVQWKVTERTVVQHGAIIHHTASQLRPAATLPAVVQRAVHTHLAPPTRQTGEPIRPQAVAAMPARAAHRGDGDDRFERHPGENQAAALPPVQYRRKPEQVPAPPAAPWTAAGRPPAAPASAIAKARTDSSRDELAPATPVRPMQFAAAVTPQPAREQPVPADFPPPVHYRRKPDQVPAPPAAPWTAAGRPPAAPASAIAKARTDSSRGSLSPAAPLPPMQFAAAATPQPAREQPVLGDLLYDQAMRGLRHAASPAPHLDMPQASRHAEPPAAMSSAPAGSGGDFRQAAPEPRLHRDDIEQLAARVTRIIQREQRREREAKGRI